MLYTVIWCAWIYGIHQVSMGMGIDQIFYLLNFGSFESNAKIFVPILLNSIEATGFHVTGIGFIICHPVCHGGFLNLYRNCWNLLSGRIPI